MSIQGVRFCDVCGGAIGIDDIAPVRVNQEGRMVQLHLHNRHSDDCLAQKLTELAGQHENGTLLAVSTGSDQEPVEHEA